MHLLLVLLLGLALAGPAVTSAVSAQEVKIRFAGTLPADSASSRAMELFKDEVARLSNGTMAVETFPAMQLGGVRDNLEQLKSGTLEAAYVPASFIAGVVPKFAVLNLPFVFKDRETTYRVLDGPLGKELEREMDNANLKSLGFWEGGWYHFTNSKRPIATPEDLVGLRIRLPNNSFHVLTLRRLGVRPVPMDIKEVYSAMQQGTVEGYESPYCNTLELKFHEVQKYLTASGHFYDLVGAVMQKRFYDGLSKERQAVVDQAARKAAEFQRTQAAQDDDRCLAELKAKGMETNAISPDAVARLRQKVVQIYKEYEPAIGRDFLARFLTANR